ncbi:hypothetical protein Pyn_37629 [Prunus yedoensis var. nudiflora]|uniref:Uncharacterized protein n=1 Tax=Prunus yedoensis var. nudiflora TaxID=2094558 RepID=A0A314U8K6_PRUYE|nr:hypothetical protein Pyn_37629 [Prunus yedoensis var. nudiflora]
MGNCKARLHEPCVTHHAKQACQKCNDFDAIKCKHKQHAMLSCHATNSSGPKPRNHSGLAEKGVAWMGTSTHRAH